jgi:hypothetical protein
MAFDLSTKKRRHHYVWQYYLKAWADDEQIFAMRGDKVFRTGTVNVAVVTDFYRIKNLTAADIAFIEATCVRNASPAIQPTLYGWFSVFGGLTAVRAALHALGIDVDKDKGSELFDIAANNAEEDLHGAIERNAIKYLDALREERLEFITNDDDALAEFLHFLCVQYTRTQNLRARVLGALKGVDTVGANIENCWGLMSHVLATNIGYGLFATKGELDFWILRSPDETAFVTSDQPVINTKAVGLPNNTEAEELDVIDKEVVH